ncbi:MAG: DNA alkylation repair protein [Nitrosopumilus sp.]|nr:DNA alkylation repair protein [Nitrosopumilus sp.]
MKPSPEIQHTVNQIISEPAKLKNETNLQGMARFGIATDKAFGIKLPVLREIAKPYKSNHDLALALWETGWHECRLLAVFIDDPKHVMENQMEHWVKDFNSWDICDQACSFFGKTRFAVQKAFEWTERKPEFEKRAGFALIAWMAVHLKKEPDKFFLQFLLLIEREACDERNFVKKAVNWALRQIGKRNAELNKAALKTSYKIKQQECNAARWIANDAIRELEGKF